MFKFLPTVIKGLSRKVSYSLSRLRRAVPPWLPSWHGLRLTLAWGMGIMLAGVLALTVFAFLLVPFTPSIDDIRKARLERPSILLSADGKQLTSFKRLNREWVPIRQLPPHVVEALIAIEDQRFYRHHGIDYRRTAVAAALSLVGKRQGGSTITQQLARNLFPEEVGRAPTLTRKIKEAITALKIESVYSKAQIIETYLNTVPFLYNADGIEMAARTYFNTSAPRLSVAEGATLVGMLKGTAYYNPVQAPERALTRRNLVLAEMARQGFLSGERYEDARRRPLGVVFERQIQDPGPAPHFAEQVRRWLTAWAERQGYNIYADGLIVHTTLDSRLQRVANQVVDRELDALQTVAEVEWGLNSEKLLSTRLSAYTEARRRIPPFRHFWRANPDLLEAFIRESPEFAKLKDAGQDGAQALAQLAADDEFMAALRARKTRLEAGFVAIDPRSGAVRAWVGSRDFAKDRYDHVAQSRRQPGSTFKAFVYAAALEDGMRADRQFVDEAVTIRLADGSVWQPGDSGVPTGETMTMEDGLVYSKNSITAQVMEQVGPRKVARLARDAGVRDSRLDPVPSLALGTSPVTLLEMVSAYGTIASLGHYTAPSLVTRVTDRHGKVLVEFSPESERVLSRDTTVQLIDMLRGAVDRGTGRGVRQIFGIDADVAGKTGTTQNNVDGWFILMHPELVAGTWVGFNDPRVRIRSNYWGQGAHNALYVVGDFFRQSLATRSLSANVWFPVPERPHTLGETIDRAGQWVRELFGIEPGGAARRSRPRPPKEYWDTGRDGRPAPVEERP